MQVLNRVLIVDDSVSTQKITKEIIDGMDITNKVDIANNGKEAIQYLLGDGETFPSPKLILLDLNMPEADGFEFLEDYISLDKKYTNNFETIIAVVSNYLQQENFEMTKYYKHYGVVGHIPKPMLEEDLIDLLEEQHIILS